MIDVCVCGAAGRMGRAVVGAVEAEPDMRVAQRVDPALTGGGSFGDLESALAEDRPDVMVDFTIPATVFANACLALRAGVHVVVGTTGMSDDELGELRRLAEGGEANALVAPNFAVGAVLMMQFAQQAARHMASAEIIELHHDRKLDRPSGTAARTARLMHEAAPDRPEPPIHSVRLPGLVAHQEVILGDVGQTLTIRHDSVDRESFMPGVLLAVRRVATLAESPVVGLEHLL